MHEWIFFMILIKDFNEIRSYRIRRSWLLTMQVTLFRRNDAHLPFEIAKEAERVKKGNPHHFTSYHHGRSIARVHKGLQPYLSHRWKSTAKPTLFRWAEFYLNVNLNQTLTKTTADGVKYNILKYCHSLKPDNVGIVTQYSLTWVHMHHENNS